MNKIGWNEYFLKIAKTVAIKSKDPNTQVGAVIVKDNKIISTGYNGMCTGVDETKIPWDRDKKDPKDNKYMYVVHAEANAIINCSDKKLLKNASIYVTDFPCNECAKLIIQSGIEKVYYGQNKYPNSDATIVAQKLFKLADINVIQEYEKKEFQCSLQLYKLDTEEANDWNKVQISTMIIRAKDEKEAEELYKKQLNREISNDYIISIKEINK